MYAWFPFHQDFFDELLQRDEFGNHTLHPRCAACRASLSSHVPASTEAMNSILTVDELY